jgi:hypothetical protein
MIKVSKTFTKPTAALKWWHDTAPAKPYGDYRTKVFGSKLSNPTRTLSPDSKTWTYTVNWATREDFDAMLADPTIIAGVNARISYNALKQIVEGPTLITEV